MIDLAARRLVVANQRHPEQIGHRQVVRPLLGDRREQRHHLLVLAQGQPAIRQQ